MVLMHTSPASCRCCDPLGREMMGTEEMWPYLLAFGGVPALLQLVTLPFFPEAPRHLYIDKGDTEGARKGEAHTSRFGLGCYSEMSEKPKG